LNVLRPYKQVMHYPVRCLCFELGDGFESLADLVGTCCERLQARNTPFNLLITDHGARVFLIPQKFSHRAARGRVASYPFLSSAQAVPLPTLSRQLQPVGAQLKLSSTTCDHSATLNIPL